MSVSCEQWHATVSVAVAKEVFNCQSRFNSPTTIGAIMLLKNKKMILSA